MGEAGHGGGIGRQQAQTLVDGCAGEADKICERAIEREHAAGEDAVGRGAAVLRPARRSRRADIRRRAFRRRSWRR